jgi:hypothetical protein
MKSSLANRCDRPGFNSATTWKLRVIGARTPERKEVMFQLRQNAILVNLRVSVGVGLC